MKVVMAGCHILGRKRIGIMVTPCLELQQHVRKKEFVGLGIRRPTLSGIYHSLSVRYEKFPVKQHAPTSTCNTDGVHEYNISKQDNHRAFLSYSDSSQFPALLL